MKNIVPILAAGMALCCAASAVLAAPGFTLIGRPSNPPAESYATCISSNGSIVAGVNLNSIAYTGFSWQNGNRVDYAQLSMITAISADGMYLTGSATRSPDAPAGNVWRASAVGVIENLGRLPNRPLGCSSTAMNADGNTIVGYATGSQSGLRIPYRWRSGVGVAELPDINGGNSGFSFANGVSDDGDIVVGSSTSAFGIIDNRPLYWDTGGAPHRLFPPAGAPTALSGSALAISGNSRVIAGGFDGNVGAVVWVDGVATRLVSTSSRLAAGATGVSYDGSVIIGEYSRVSSESALFFIYTQMTGLVEAKAFLLNNGVPLSPTGTIEQLTCVSRDGLSFAGTYIDLANGIERQAFVATIPTPGVSVIFGVAAATLTRRRRPINHKR